MVKNKKTSKNPIVKHTSLTSHDVIAICCFFLSGALGLAYEICWIRKASLVFGSAIFALSTVLAVFFGGLALGSFIFGRYSQKVIKPLRVYAILEIGIGALALLSPFLFAATDFLFGLFYDEVLSSFPLLSFLRFVFVSIILLPPAMLMGGTLPLFCRQYVYKKERISLSVGLLYGVNTLGAGVGTFICGFLLIPNIGVNMTLYIGGIANIAIGLLVRKLPLKAPELERIVVQKRHSRLEEIPSDAHGKAYWVTWVGVLFFLTGFVALGNEVVWSRYLSLIVYNSVYTYTLTITIILFGIVVGSILTARIFDRTSRRPLIFGGVQIATGITIMIVLMLPAKFWSSVIDSTDFTTLIWIVSLILFVPAVLSGISYPLAIRMVVDDPSNASSGVGVMTAVNTLGGIVGSIAVGFFLLPDIGLQKTIMVMTSISLLVGFIALLFLDSARPRGLKYMFIVLVSAVWWFIPFVTGTKLPQDFLGGSGQLVDFREGVNSFVSVVKKADELDLSVDRAWQGSNRKGHQVMAAHVPMLLHPDPKTVLVIGLGAGQTPSRFLMHDIQELECVEIEPEVIQLVKTYFPSDWIGDDRTHFIVEDGRNYIRHSKKKFDVISIEVGQVYRPGVAPFYTFDFYERVRLRLNKNGIISQFVPMSFFSTKEFKTVVASFIRVFPQSTLWYNTQELLLIGSKSNELKLNKDRLDMLASNKMLNTDLKWAYWGGIGHTLNRPEVFIAGFLVGPKSLIKLCKNAEIYFDDKPFLEYSTVREALTSTPIVELIFKNLDPLKTILNVEFDDRSDRSGQIIRKNNLNNIIALDMIRDGSHYLKSSQLEDRIEFFHELVKLNPDNVKFNSKLAQALILKKRFDQAIIYLRKVLELTPDSTRAIYRLGNIFAIQGSFDEAVKYYQKALKINPNFAEAHYALGNVFAEYDRKNEAVKHYEVAIEIEPELVDAHIDLGIVLEEKGKIGEAIHHFKKALAFRPESVFVLEKLAKSYKNMKEYRQTLFFYNEILKLIPENPNIYYNMACIHALGNHTEDAVKWLKKAVDNGFDNWEHIKNDKELENIRETYYFKSLVGKK